MPTIRDDDSGYNQVLKIARTVFDNPKRHFDFNFSKCSKLDHNAVAILGGLTRYVDFQNSSTQRTISGVLKSNLFADAGVMFLVTTMSSVVSGHLISNNFLSHFSAAVDEDYPVGGYIGYREHNNLLNEDNIADHLRSQWLSGEKLKLSHLLKDAIVSRIFEIFMNAYGHGVSIQNIGKLGVYSCGQYDKKEKKLNISVLDFGPGIVENVKRFNSSITDSHRAMEWALAKGNTTATDSQGANIPRGLGFDLLHEFIALNDGEMRVYSNDVQVLIKDKEKVKIIKSKSYFNGTLVSIKINCDDKEYYFKSEDQPQYF